MGRKVSSLTMRITRLRVFPTPGCGGDTVGSTLSKPRLHHIISEIPLCVALRTPKPQRTKPATSRPRLRLSLCPKTEGRLQVQEDRRKTPGGKQSLENEGMGSGAELRCTLRGSSLGSLRLCSCSHGQADRAAPKVRDLATARAADSSTWHTRNNARWLG